MLRNRTHQKTHKQETSPRAAARASLVQVLEQCHLHSCAALVKGAQHKAFWGWWKAMVKSSTIPHTHLPTPALRTEILDLSPNPEKQEPSFPPTWSSPVFSEIVNHHPHCLAEGWETPMSSHLSSFFWTHSPPCPSHRESYRFKILLGQNSNNPFYFWFVLLGLTVPLCWPRTKDCVLLVWVQASCTCPLHCMVITYLLSSVSTRQ